MTKIIDSREEVYRRGRMRGKNPPRKNRSAGVNWRPMTDDERRARNREYMRQYTKGKRRERERVLAKVRREAEREECARLVREFRANGCLLCPEREPVALCAHHVNPAEKDFNVSACRKADLLRLELAKCVCLCDNCHRKLHAGILTLPA